MFLFLAMSTTTILVMMDQPMKKAKNKPEVARRLVQWAIKLSLFDINYHPKTDIKSQSMADFIVEFTLSNKKKAQDELESWTIMTDRSSIQKRGGVEVIINTPEGETLKYGVRFQFPVTNNELVGLGVRSNGFNASPPKPELRSRRGSKASIIRGRNESTKFESGGTKTPKH